MVGLLGYPFLLEPALRLAEQRSLWRIGYGFLAKPYLARDRGPWARLGQLLAIGSGVLVAGLVAVLWVVGAADVSAKDHAEGLADGGVVTTQWGPLMAALVLAVVLAAAAALSVRRGRAVVLATVRTSP